MTTNQMYNMAKDVENELKEDILFRYNNTEYWDYTLIENFQIENDISDNDMKLILEMLK